MKVYLDLVVLLNFAVNYGLLRMTAQLTGARAGPWRLGAGAAVGALYAGAWVLPGLGFLAGNLWRVVFLGLMVTAAFGRAAAAPPGLFIPGLSLALGGLALCLRLRSFWALVLGVGTLALLCRLFLRGGMGHAGQLVPVSIALGSKRVQLTALRDSGNTLSDPFSGQGVLVAQYDTAERLLPICRDQLRDPGKALEALHAQAPAVKCRLIPYRAVGAGGLLLAVQCDQVTIGGKPAGPLVAFAPDRLSAAGEYEALTGGGQYV
ncbi:MAG: sigma-E processing peptidase SpoIIGA [Oscillospiraceae bacterium]